MGWLSGKCDRCGGKGWVETGGRNTRSYDGDTHDFGATTETCPRCKGTGEHAKRERSTRSRCGSCHGSGKTTYGTDGIANVPAEYQRMNRTSTCSRCNGTGYEYS